MGKKEHSARYEALKSKYKRGGCTKSQLRKYVDLNALYDWEYEEITGEKY